MEIILTRISVIFELSPSFERHWLFLKILLCCAAGMDLPDSLSSPISIVHCSREDYQAISCTGTELL